MTVHCFFEQSGTFKNEFKKLGINAYDYDILDDFGETDYKIDLFSEIEKAYRGGQSVFERIKSDDLIFAFFPCTRFEEQIQMHFRGTVKQLCGWSEIDKLEYDLDLHEELATLYRLVSKLAIVCLSRNIPLIIENPYSTTHYLVKYWAIPATIIDSDRTRRGDYYKKPTQFWFIGIKPKNNFPIEAIGQNQKDKTIENITSKVERSLIHRDYARRFIQEFII